MITITNSGTDNLNIYWIDYTGAEVNYKYEPSPVSTIAGGDTVKLTAYRGSVFSVLNDSGECVGIVKPRESRNSYTFGTFGTFGQ